MEGHKQMFNDTLVTVWSAPNYCYRCGNVAAILELDENLTKFYKIFEAAPQEARGVPKTTKKPAPEYFLWINLEKEERKECLFSKIKSIINKSYICILALKRE